MGCSNSIQINQPEDCKIVARQRLRKLVKIHLYCWIEKEMQKTITNIMSVPPMLLQVSSLETNLHNNVY